MSAGDVHLESKSADADVLIQVNDGGVTKTAIAIDASADAQINLACATDATSPTAAAIVSAGGGAFAKSVYMGGLLYKTRTITDATTITANDIGIICDKSTAFTQELPAATGSGRVYVISNMGAGTVTLDGDSSETINGDLTQAIYTDETLQVHDYASGKWRVI